MASVDKLNMEELHNLNTYIVDRIKDLRRIESTKASLDWGIGDTAYFKDKSRNVVSGVVLKVNPTRLKIRWNGMTWTVPYSLVFKSRGEVK